MYVLYDLFVGFRRVFTHSHKLTGTSDVSTEFLCAIRNVVGKNLGIVVELLNSFRSRPPYVVFERNIDPWNIT